MELAELRAVWVEVLDDLERHDRIAWLAYFDARLAALVDDEVTLDFSDPAKFADGHDIRSLLDPGKVSALESAIHRVTGHHLRCVVTNP